MPSQLGGWPKRAIDIFGAAAGLIMLAPFLLLVALIVKLLDGGPAFYGHHRVGYGGRMFRCWKFRTMSPDAEARLDEVLAKDPLAAEEWSATRKLVNDPRVTPIGAFLRRSSIDELPQLFNVLIGEMSLVGPRPITREELARLRTAARLYLSARPGLSGLWQVSGRSKVSHEHRVALDAHYVTTWSLVSDLWILARTVPAVLFGRGAY